MTATTVTATATKKVSGILRNNQMHWVGDGFPVRTLFAYSRQGNDISPFLMLDYGKGEFPPTDERKGVGEHPHRGFETVTYMIDGIMEHQDSHGGGGTIADGDTQWMTAGGGILHIEAPPEHLVTSGGLFHGVQLWVNLPREDKLVAPRYQDISRDRVTLLSSPDGGALIRVIAGDLDGHRGPGSTHTPITLLHMSLARGARVTVPWNAEFNALAYVLAGEGSAGADRRPVHAGQTVVFGRGDTLTIDAADQQDSRTDTLEVFVLGGKPIREPVAMAGPFVMNTKAEVITAFEDFQAGRFGSLPATGGLTGPAQ